MVSPGNPRLLSAAAWLARRLPQAGLLAMYRLGPISRLLRSLLNRSVPPGIAQVTVAGGRLAGARMLLDLRTEKDLWLGSYEPFMLEAIERLARPGMTAYDVGAHIGYVTLCLAQAVGPAGRVVAFEPSSANLERLHGNLELNGVQDRVQVVPAAAGAAAGRQRFRPRFSAATGRLVGPADQQDVVQGDQEVEVLALDEFAEQQRAMPDIVKMDVEGGEAAALRGMRRLLHRSGVILLLELHDAQGPQASAALGELRQAGYQIRRLSRGYPALDSKARLGRKAYLLALPPGGLAAGEGP